MNLRRVLALDAALAVALSTSVAALLRSPDLHGALSLTLVGGVLAHVAVHRRWIVRAVSRTRSIARSRTARDLTVATALAALFLPVTLTGLSLFSTLDRGDDVHAVTGWLFLSLVAVHVALHGRWIVRVGTPPRS